MSKPLRALIVEDVELDALLLVRELERGGFQVISARVDTEEMMAAALVSETWDVIIADYSLPRFSAPRALTLVQERALDIPFIVISGTVNETLAVEVMRAGAQDFMAKSNFARLIPAIERELREAAVRSERSQMQGQLLFSERMASVGTLAAGVAHEINNPLAAVMANLEYIAESLGRLRAREPGDMWHALDELDEPLHDAREAAERVRLIVRDLKVFSRADDESISAVDVRRVIESSLRMASNEIRHRARVVKEYGVVPLVLGNEARLGQVFLNLIVNAAQSIPEGRSRDNEIRLHTGVDSTGQVVVEVSDTGTGIAEQVRSRIFDPFFTTKPVGMGTGLGLAICQRIVTALGGRIHFESELGRGSLFRITLPCAPAESAVPSPAAGSVVSSRIGRILVIDDEPLLGTVVRRMLPEQDVVVANSAREALACLSRGERFDILLCDLMMPEMTGMDFYEELRGSDPEQAGRVVFMTGGAFTSRSREFLEEVPNLSIEKPFPLAHLRALVQTLLGQG